MKNTTTDIQNINDSFFHKIFDSPENARDFLEQVLPTGLKKQLDLANIEIEDTKYVSNEYKKGFSDIVVKTVLRTTKEQIPVDIYFLLEHKSEGRVEVLLQVLKYMVFEWEKDYNNNKSPRLIIPVVFYHGAEEWKVPRSFAEQFDVDDEVKRYLLDYRYILFDTNPWDFGAESNKEFKNNVFLFTAMVLMKAAYKKDIEAILEIFRFWRERGFTENKDVVLFFMKYISYTQDIGRDDLKEILDNTKIEGGDIIMPTLAQQFREEFREEFREKFREEFIETLGPEFKKEGKKEGKKEEKFEIARRMLLNNFSLEQVILSTGLTKKDIKTLIN
ncbi:MAG: Rpn family recombination-promoting nuclease/putative transposase [Candidatus Aminicenantes bacterium]|nr:Rpn family recombination-promoting nuclease/putative transposase [Candidatus Aminicenantes bacterium]